MASRALKPIAEQGEGPALLLIPGIQGRWEWMRPAVSALARHFHVITFSLLGEPGTGRAPAAFDAYIAQVDRALDVARRNRAVVCGVSYGGLIALRYAATRSEMVDRLVLASTPSPTWRPDQRVRRYAGAPWRYALAFAAGAPGRLLREVSAAIPAAGARSAATLRYVGSVVRHPTSPRRMAGRVTCVGGCDFVADARAVRAPTLVLTGEADLDRVVPVAGTREYFDLIPGAIGVTLERTGHIGLVTRPDAFADVIWRWSQSGSAGSRGK